MPVLRYVGISRRAWSMGSNGPVFQGRVSISWGTVNRNWTPLGGPGAAFLSPEQVLLVPTNSPHELEGVDGVKATADAALQTLRDSPSVTDEAKPLECAVCPRWVL